MKKLIPLAVLALTTLAPAPRSTAQDDADKDVDAALQQASEAAEKMGMKMPDVKAIMAESDKEEAKEKAAKQAVVDAPGSAKLPDWTPKVPQFTPDGPVAKKLIDEEPMTALTGTSTLTPAELADDWEKATARMELGHGRNNMNINGTRTVIVYLRTMDDPSVEVRMEARRAPDEKITHVTVMSPLPTPRTANESD